MRPLAAAVRPWHPSELARLGRNAVEDPPQAGCLGRTAAAPWRISRRGWASACDVAGGRGGCRRRTTQPIEATGLAQGSAGVLAARSMAGHELTPSPLAPREGSFFDGGWSCQGQSTTVVPALAIRGGTVAVDVGPHNALPRQRSQPRRGGDAGTAAPVARLPATRA